MTQHSIQAAAANKSLCICAVLLHLS
jgi:hypothetical protein